MDTKNTIETTFIEEKATSVLKDGFIEAENLLSDEDKLERFLQRLEQKLKTIPMVGDKLAYVPVFASMLKSYAKKEYTDLPIGTIIAIVSALLYLVNPLDIIPDALPGIGHLDDAFVIAACLGLVSHDVHEYEIWRENNNKKLFPDGNEE